MHTWLIEWGLILLTTWTGIPRGADPRPLTFDDRVRAQEAIERVYYEHRIWPKENPGPKPPFEQMISRAQIEAKVEDTLKKSVALDKFWQRPIQPEQLQAEMDRMAKQTQDPETLKELFAALDNDPYLIAECLARPVLADRMIRNWCSPNSTPDTRSEEQYDLVGFVYKWRQNVRQALDIAPHHEDSFLTFRIPSIKSSGKDSETGSWINSSLYGMPEGRQWHTAIWTGSEMIIWGGYSSGDEINNGGRYCPSIDSWTPTNCSDKCPESRRDHTAIWTGKEMIIWGGNHTGRLLDTGGRYDPVKDAWQEISIQSNTPSGRYKNTAVWTGSEMIIWGGTLGSYLGDTGARYDPESDTWKSMATWGFNGKGGSYHTAIWTGTEMIVWGGTLDVGGRYSPSSNSWLSVSDSGGCPTSRWNHTAVWTGSEMIVWGGSFENTGGRYDPRTDTWAATSTGENCPPGRRNHTAVWTGLEMIIWGGYPLAPLKGDGGKYDPATDTWKAVSTAEHCPDAREGHTAVWSGTEMIVWGSSSESNTGGRYNPISDDWLPIFRGPSNRHEHSAIWTGVEMILWGGRKTLGDTLLKEEIGCCYQATTDSWFVIPTPEAYSEGNIGHSAIWTGTEMIIWGGLLGGESDLIPTNAGARYNPGANTWTMISNLENCPSKRYGHTAVWTGEAMVTWGGIDGSQMLNSGGRYFPASDSWLVTSTGNDCPTPRRDHAAVWSGREMIIWGGYDGIAYPFSGGRYYADADYWTATSLDANCPKGRTAHTALWSGSMMIVWGGKAGKQFFFSGGQYDPLLDSWLPTDTSHQCPGPRYLHTAIWTGTEMIVWGGIIKADVGNGAADSGGIYNILTQEWRETPAGYYCPSARYNHTAIWNGSAMIVWGGLGGMASGGIYRPYSSHERPVEKP